MTIKWFIFITIFNSYMFLELIFHVVHVHLFVAFHSMLFHHVIYKINYQLYLLEKYQVKKTNHLIHIHLHFMPKKE